MPSAVIALIKHTSLMREACTRITLFILKMLNLNFKQLPQLELANAPKTSVVFLSILMERFSSNISRKSDPHGRHLILLCGKTITLYPGTFI